jgi:hypothetical protein
MGYGAYSAEAHEAMTTARAHAPKEKVFTATSCHPAMNPHGVKARESRDSADHPQSTAIVFALDVSGSMGDIPHALATKTLPAFMRALGDAGVPDPQVLFMAIGHAVSDRAPLQVGQFESTAELMDQWLTRLYLEGGGGGGNESYELGMYFAARHTATDCWEKRGKRGYFFITGDEPPNPGVVAEHVQRLIGETLPADLPLADVVTELQEKWEPFYLIPDPGRAQQVERAWRNVLGDRVLCMRRPQDTSHVAAGAVALLEGAVPDLRVLADRFVAAGLSRSEVSGVVAALAPFAASLGKDGNPNPALSP